MPDSSAIQPIAAIIGALIAAGIAAVIYLVVKRKRVTRTVSTEELMRPGPLPEQAVGEPNAPVTIVEYTSMTCPYCATFHEKTYPELKQKYIDTGKVRFIVREFGLDELSAAGFMLARCAGEGKYFPMIETLFHRQEEWAVQPPLPLRAIAEQAGFTQQSFEQCLSNKKLLKDLEQVRKRGAKRFGVDSTPTFFVNGVMLKGAPTMEILEEMIEPYLKGG
jgi:protein-disulfide isomerase